MVNNDDLKLIRENEEQTRILLKVKTLTGAYPLFADTDWCGIVPIVRSVTLTWEEFVAIANKLEEWC